MIFRTPMPDLDTRDLARALGFCRGLGFIEPSCTPDEGDPDHVELRRDGFTDATAAGAPALPPPHDWFADLRMVRVADPDGNPIRFAWRRS